MRCSLYHSFVFCAVWLFIMLLPGKVSAQYNENDDAPTLDTANAFCIRMSHIMLQTDSDFVRAKAKLVDSVGQKTWECRENFKMPGSRQCLIFEKGGVTTYVAFYISRGSKDDLGPSYNNLYQQIKDCLGFNYVYKEKKTSGAEKLLRITNYECEMQPYGDATPEQADMRIVVQPTPDGNYELILEMTRYKGFYTNR